MLEEINKEDILSMNRKINYMSIAQQLDNLYKDIEKGFFGEHARESSFFKNIKKTKEKFPKPE